MIRSFLKLYTLDLGIRTEHLMTMRMELPEPEVSNPGDAQGLLRSAETAARRPPGQRGRGVHDERAAVWILAAPDGDGGSPGAQDRRGSA